MKKVMDYINKAYDVFDKINEWFIIILISIMCIDLLAQVIFRYVFNHPLTWSEELARYTFVWIALLGSAWCGRNFMHVRMTAIIDRLSPSMMRIQQLVVSVICAGTCYFLFPYACNIFLFESKLPAVTLGISLGIEYIAAPVGLLMMAIQWTVNALYVLLDWEGFQARYLNTEGE